MTKATSIKDIAGLLPTKKRYTSTDIRNVADIDAIRKEKTKETNNLTFFLDVPMSIIFNDIPFVEDKVCSNYIDTALESSIADCFDEMKNKVIKYALSSMIEEVKGAYRLKGQPDINSIDSISIEKISKNESIFDEPSYFSDYLKISIKYSILETVYETDKEVLNRIKSYLGNLDFLKTL